MKHVAVLITVVVTTTGCFLAQGNDDARLAAGALAATAEGSLGYFDLPYDLIEADCISTVGDNSDPDGDSIPESVTASVNCSRTEDGLRKEVTGSIVVSDPESSAPAFGFDAVYNLSATVKDASTNEVLATGALGTATSATEVNGEFGIAVAGAEIANERNRNHGWDVVYRPAGAWNPGDPLVEGELELDGAWTAAFESGSIQAAISTLEPLHVDPSCGGFDRGALEAVAVIDGQPQIIQTRWTDCTPLLSINGEPVDPPDIAQPEFDF